MATDIDPVTGYPREMDAATRAAERKNRKESQAKEDAKFLSAVSSEAGEALISMVRGKLHERVEQVLKEDPQSRIYLEILATLRVRKGIAERALQTLINKYLGETSGNE